MPCRYANFCVLALCLLLPPSSLPAGQNAAIVKPARIQKLIGQLDNPSYKLRTKAQAALVQIGSAALPALRTTLRNSTSEEVRDSASKIMEMIRQSRMVRISKTVIAATAIVDAPNRFAGRGGRGGRGRMAQTAVCVHPSGVFVVSTDVRYSPSQSLQLVVHPGTKKQKIVKAHVLHTDTNRNLALLRAEGKVDTPAVALGLVGRISELAEVVALTFPPFQAQEVVNPAGQVQVATKYPTVTAYRAVVTSMYMQSGQPYRIKFDAEGFSGGVVGPLLDMNGRLLGLGLSDSTSVRRRGATAPVVASGIVTPVNHIRDSLAEPILQFAPPVIKVEDAHKPVEFQASVLQFLPSAKPVEVDLVLINNGKERKIPMTLKNGVYKATAVPAPAAESKPKLRISVAYADGSIEASIPDRAIAIGKQKVQLGEIKELKIDGNRVHAMLANGKTAIGAASDLDGLTAPIGGVPRRLNLARAVQATIRPPKREPNVACAIVVRRQRNVAAHWQGQLVLVNKNSKTPGAAQGLQISAAARRNAERIFQRYDQNGDGKLEGNELPAVIMRVMDKNGDQIVSFREIMEYYAERDRDRGFGGREARPAPVPRP